MGRKRSSDLSASLALVALIFLFTLIAHHPVTSLFIIAGITTAWLSSYFIKRNNRLPTYDMTEIDQMSGHEFEEFVCSLFQSLGYRAEATKKSRDFGVDIVCIHGRDKIALQTKRYSKNVNLKCVQEVTAGMRKYNCNKSMVVTNSYFTQSAIDLAMHNDCELVNRDSLIDLIQHSARLSARSADKPFDEPQPKVTGDSLLSRIKELGDCDKRDIAKACGYSRTVINGIEIIDYNAFYNAVLDARNARYATLKEPASRVVLCCPMCGRKLGLPEGKNGKVKCPACSSDFNAVT